MAEHRAGSRARCPAARRARRWSCTRWSRALDSLADEFMAMTGRAGRVFAQLRSDRKHDWHDATGRRLPDRAPAARGRSLVDTGFHPSVATDPKQNLGPRARPPLQHRTCDPSRRSRPAARARHRPRRRRRGDDDPPPHRPRLGDLRVHGGDLRARRRESGTRSTRPAPTLHGYVRHHVEHAVEYLEVPYDPARSARIRRSARSFDLFGDGSVRLVYTPGHNRGTSR